MIRQAIYSVLFLGVLMSACGSFEQDFEVDLGELPLQMAVSAINNLGDTSLRGQVQQVMGILDKRDAVLIGNARVRLSSAKGLLLETQTDTFGFFSFPMNQPDLQAGAVITLEITAANYPDCKATITIPTVPQMSNVTLELEAASDPFGEKLDLLRFELQDDAATRDYYAVELSYLFNDGNVRFINPIYPDVLDPELEPTYSHAYVFNDGSFDGQLKKVRIEMPSYYRPPAEVGQEGDSIQVRLRKITPDHYRFIRSLTDSEASSDNPFGEPVIVTTNIEGGAGIFTINQLQELFLPVE